MTSELIQAIEAERHRQNALHPVAFTRLVPAGVTSENLREKLEKYQEINNLLEHAGIHNAMTLAQEELYEFFTVETKEEQLAEAVQNIAFWVRIYEELA